MKKRHRSRVLPIAAGIIAAATAILIVLNIASTEKQIKRTVTHRYAVTDPQFTRAMGVLLGPPLVEGNRVETLLNGDEIFPSMLQAIRSAKKTITFETYIYWSGDIGREFARALSERAERGVKVHVILDWIGSEKMDEEELDKMRKSGVDVRKYHRPHWYTLHRLNNRTHRKLLVVDGKIGFTGGVGIADKWTGRAQDPEHWRDTHFRIEGPAVLQMQAAFMDNWTKMTGDVLHTVDYFPPPQRAGSEYAQVFQSSVEGGAESMHLMYLLSVAAATKTIHLSMAYFTPDDVALATLVAAAARGVKIRIIVPGEHTDAQIVQDASRAKWGELLKHGVEIYRYQPTMFHTKVLVVDGIWTSVGSTNFDNRSFRLNDEANLNVYNAALAARQIADFEADLERSRRVTLAEWQDRPWREKLRERVALIFDAQL